MAHPNGGNGNIFQTNTSFVEAFDFVAGNGSQFISTTGEQISARQGFARDNVTPVIVFNGERHRHGSACQSCWGFRLDCNGSYIGQCVEALDQVIRLASVN